MQFYFLRFPFFCSQFFYLIARGFILFTHNLFNLIARFLSNCFASVLLNTLINLILVINIFLKIFLTPILFLLNNYTVNIDGNVCNVFKMFSALVQICCMYLWLCITTTNMFSHVSVYGTYLFYLIFVYLHNIFYITDGRILCFIRAFIHWIKEVFNSFIHTNITIRWFYFIFRCAQSLSLAIIIIQTQSLFVFIHYLLACKHCVDGFQFFIIHKSNPRLNSFVDVSNFFVDAFFPLASYLTPWIHRQTWSLFLIRL